MKLDDKWRLFVGVYDTTLFSAAVCDQEISDISKPPISMKTPFVQHKPQKSYEPNANY